MTTLLKVIGAGVVCVFAVFTLCAAFAMWMHRIDMMDEDERREYFSGEQIVVLDAKPTKSLPPLQQIEGRSRIVFRDDVDGLDVFDGDCE